MTDLTVIGIGDVVRNRYISALKTEILRNDLRITNLIDIKPKSEILSDSKQKLLFKSCFYQLHDTNPKTLLSLLEEKGLSNQPVLIATPTKFHVPYAKKLLQAGIPVAIEKPYAVNFKDINNFDTFSNVMTFSAIKLNVTIDDDTLYDSVDYENNLVSFTVDGISFFNVFTKNGSLS